MTRNEKILEVIGAVVTIIAVAGVLLNNRKSRYCFLLWMVSNTLSGLIHCRTGPWTLVLRDAIFLVLAVEGYILWR